MTYISSDFITRQIQQFCIYNNKQPKLFSQKKKWLTATNWQKHTPNCNNILISSFLEINFEINISDKKSRRFDLPEVIFKCIKVL